MADIVYTFEGSVYLNITNSCPCKCKFCIRNNSDSVGDADTLWFSGHNPSFDEIKKAIDEYDFTGYNGEVIFCGYGEPTFAYDNLIKTCKYIHEKLGLKVRLNTNGLSDLLNKKPTAKELCENTDKISISLNEYSSEKYCELCAPAFGEKSFDAIIKFAKSVNSTVRICVFRWSMLSHKRILKNAESLPTVSVSRLESEPMLPTENNRPSAFFA